MFGYTPKLFDAAISAFICILLIALTGYIKNPQVVRACVIGAWIFAILAAVVLGLLVWEERNKSVAIVTDFIREFGRLDDEARAAVAFRFPELRYKMKAGKVREFFEDTNATMAQFRHFLETSDSRYISPVRDWGTAEYPRWAHEEIRLWLEANKYILEESYSGNHSWAWRGNSYRHLMAYWNPARKLQDMNEGTEAL